MRDDFVFVLPANSEAVSGGNIYNAELIRELRGQSPVTTMSFDECVDAVRRGVRALYFIDTLNLREFLSLPQPKSGQQFALVVHHLPSLEPGIDPRDEALQIEASALPRFDAYLATSPFTAQYLTSRGIRSEKIMTVIPGVRIAESAAARRYEPPLRAVMVGNLIRRKAILEFLSELGSRASHADAFAIDILGRLDMDTVYVAACGDLVARSDKLRRSVQIEGAVPYDRIDQWYRTSHLLVSAAKMETFGMALAEARAHGLPILALDRGHVRNHFTDGENGMLADSIAVLAEQFIGLVRDPPRMSELFSRAQAFKAGGDYNWKAAAARFRNEMDRWSQATSS
jgi:glycosyltransferase involved in cell wall biosynthesis